MRWCQRCRINYPQSCRNLLSGKSFSLYEISPLIDTFAETMIRTCIEMNLELSVMKSRDFNRFIVGSNQMDRQHPGSYQLCLENILRYHTPVPILQLRKYGIAQQCIYFDVISVIHNIHIHSVKTHLMLALYSRGVNEKLLCFSL
jgi:hypothetical protein